VILAQTSLIRYRCPVPWFFDVVALIIAIDVSTAINHVDNGNDNGLGLE